MPRQPVTTDTTPGQLAPGNMRARLVRALRLEWLGQTAASLLWIGSVLTYGISSTGDWLQLFAASAWLVANVASVASIRED